MLTHLSPYRCVRLRVCRYIDISVCRFVSSVCVRVSHVCHELYLFSRNSTSFPFCWFFFGIAPHVRRQNVLTDASFLFFLLLFFGQRRIDVCRRDGTKTAHLISISCIQYQCFIQGQSKQKTKMDNGFCSQNQVDEVIGNVK